MISIQEKIRILEQIAAANGVDRERLTASQVLEAAQASAHPFHSEFDWDDASAGHKYRLMKARALIRSVPVRLRIENLTIESVAYVRDPLLTHREQGYIHITSAIKRREEAIAIIENELVRIEGGIQRARKIANILGVVEDLETLLRNIILIKAKVGKQRQRKKAA